jgi:hypothetical protein
LHKILHAKNLIIMFHPDYNYITDILLESIVKRAYYRLLHHSRSPIPPEQISEKCIRIEDYLRHTLEIYQTSLNRKCKTMRHNKALRSRSWAGDSDILPLALPAVCVIDNGIQTDAGSEITCCNHEEENNRRVMNELKVLSQHLLDYNKKTFEKFMRDANEEYDKRISVNKKLRCEIDTLKLQVQKAEKIITSLKSNSNTSGLYPNQV